MMRSFFDTNVLVYLFDEDSAKRKARAQVVLEQESEAGRAVLSTQVLQEFFVTVTRKLASPRIPSKGRVHPRFPRNTLKRKRKPISPQALHELY
jgi:predicted nucleic acid-binding protein